MILVQGFIEFRVVPEGSSVPEHLFKPFQYKPEEDGLDFPITEYVRQLSSFIGLANIFVVMFTETYRKS